jgi:hypothetical protein
MGELDLESMLAGVKEELERRGVEMKGLSLDDLGDAMAHPEAARTVEEIMGREITSVQVGDPAPDFDLPLLIGPDLGQCVRLSEHFGERPVALIFGSYT